jgi:pyrroline-5-carboxylate reductase
MFVDALADAGVLGGLHRDQAVHMAAQMLYGSAALLKETGKSPAELREMVCSPAGTTIEAVASLEDSGFRGAVIKAARAAMDKAKKMG